MKTTPTQQAQDLAAMPVQEPGSLFDIAHLGDFCRDKHIHEIRSKAHAVYVGRDTVLCRALGRYKLFVAGSDVGFASNLILDGYWEIEVSEFIVRNVRPGMRVFDVGANVGYYTHIFADLVGKNGSVTALEPNPDAIRLLRNSLSLNGFLDRVEVLPYAAWNSSGVELQLKTPEGEPKNSHIVAGNPGLNSAHEHTVRSITLDAAASEVIDFIKIDVEGSEENVWDGMTGLLARSPNIIVLLEFSQLRYKAPANFLIKIKQIFPLRYLDGESKIHPITEKEIMENFGDLMLVLSNSDAIL